jgi:hypothetical protein
MEGALASGVAVYDDFTASDWPGEKWYRHLPAPGIWDPVTRVTCGGGSLTLEAKPFTLTCRDAHDNVKALIYSTAEVSPGEHGLLTVETEMRVTTFGTERNPFGAEAGDVRLGCGAFNTIDTRTSWCSIFSSATAKSFRSMNGCRSRRAKITPTPLSPN